MKYIIKDWAGNRMFAGMEFDTFEDGWEHIYLNAEGDEDVYGEYYVVEAEV